MIKLTEQVSMDPESSSQAPLRRMESLSISPEVFEKLYLSPENAVKGDLRKTFGNPTPVFVFTIDIYAHNIASLLTCCRALLGFVVALSPLSIELMGWRGATGVGATMYEIRSAPTRNERLRSMTEEQTISSVASCS